MLDEFHLLNGLLVISSSVMYEVMKLLENYTCTNSSFQSIYSFIVPEIMHMSFLPEIKNN